MDDVDQYPIYSVAVDPDYCPQCGTEVGRREFGAGPEQWCRNCEMVLARNPLAAVHVVVRHGDRVLLLDEPMPQHDGVWSLPGGHASHDEGPREAAIRELAEETGLHADPEALSLLTVTHAETPETAFHFSTYTLDRSAATGELRPEAEGFEVATVPVTEALASTDRLRESDRERIAMAFDREAELDR